ncbi:MAG TPA: hypothetical protein HPP97_00970 [Desulfuromonadales bacterium]|nr:hypothetical protein [Desulfuromonadales bacterium]
MKEKFKTLAKSLAVSLILAIPVVATAAPTAPVMGMTVSTTKIFEGNCRSAGRSLVTDGTNYYSAFITDSTGAGRDAIKVVQSNDGGLTWGGSIDITKTAPGTLGQGVAIAISGDAAFPTKKVVHVTWEQNDGVTDGIYYSSADASDLTVWSAPLRINGSALTKSLPEVVSILANSTGTIHVVFEGADNKLYYTTASRFDSAFNEPVALPFPAWNDANGWEPIPATAIDSKGKVHVAAGYSITPGAAGYQYIKQTATGWTTPVVAIAPTTPYGQGSITTFDTNTIYMVRASDSTTLNFFKSSNGGSSWSKKTIATAPATDMFSGRLSIVVDKLKKLTAAASYWTANGGESTKMYRSTDLGVTWSAATTFNNQLTRPSLTVDADGKVGMELRTSVGLNPPHYFTKEK